MHLGSAFVLARRVLVKAEKISSPLCAQRDATVLMGEGHYHGPRYELRFTEIREEPKKNAARSAAPNKQHREFVRLTGKGEESTRLETGVL
jgi:hypothetical protein